MEFLKRIVGDEAAGGVAKLLQSEATGSLDKRLGDAIFSTGAASRVVEINQDNLKGDLARANSHLKNIGIFLFDYGSSAVRALFSPMNKALDWVDKALMPEPDTLAAKVSTGVPALSAGAAERKPGANPALMRYALTGSVADSDGRNVAEFAPAAGQNWARMASSAGKELNFYDNSHNEYHIVIGSDGGDRCLTADNVREIIEETNRKHSARQRALMTDTGWVVGG